MRNATLPLDINNGVSSHLREGMVVVVVVVVHRAGHLLAPPDTVRGDRCTTIRPGGLPFRLYDALPVQSDRGICSPRSTMLAIREATESRPMCALLAGSVLALIGRLAQKQHRYQTAPEAHPAHTAVAQSGTKRTLRVTTPPSPPPPAHSTLPELGSSTSLLPFPLSPPLL